MSKNATRNKKPTRKQKIDNQDIYTKSYAPKITPKPIYCKTANHKQYLHDIEHKQIILGTGCSGTGKTYIAGAWASNQLLLGNCQRIVLTRPAVQAGETLGFLRGSKEEKYEPYLRAFKEVFAERLGAGTAEYNIKTGIIEGIPVGDMRGLSFHNAIIIMDEAQNATPEQQELVVSRVGNHSKLIICGDYKRQMDIRGLSGLQDVKRVLGHLPEVGVTEFTTDDIMRSDLAKKVITAYYERG